MKHSNQISFQESRQILTLAVPIVIAQLSQTAMGFVDTLMAARYSTEDLAAVALGSGIWLPVMLSLSGVLMAITPMVAQQVGNERLRRTRSIFNQGVLVSAIASIAAWLILRNMAPVLELMDVTGSLKQKTINYLEALSWGLPGMMIYQTCRSYCEGFGKTKPLMKIGIFALLCNIPLNWLLIYGNFGFPELGGEGCGWATTIVMWVMAFLSIIYLKKSHHFRKLKLINRPRLKLKLFSNLLRIGIPIGFTLFIEVSMFTAIALLIARLGDTVIAAHQITLSFTGIVFMIPLSISMALTIRVGQLLGQGNSLGARTTAITGFAIVCCTAITSCTMISLLSTQITGLYSEQQDIIKLASSLLLIAAIFQIPDGIQVAAIGILRGHKDTETPLLLVFISYWLIGLPIGYALGLTDILTPALGASGFWIGLVIGLTISAILLLMRYRSIRKQCQNCNTV